jgi:hypothetical protein
LDQVPDVAVNVIPARLVPLTVGSEITDDLAIIEIVNDFDN